jgi:hypothetical protein
MLHIGLSTVSKTPEWELDKTETDMLANATVNVLQQFDIRPDPKIEAIFGLITAAGIVYAPRFILYRNRIASKAEIIPNEMVLDFPPAAMRN